MAIIHTISYIALAASIFYLYMDRQNLKTKVSTLVSKLESPATNLEQTIKAEISSLIADIKKIL